MGIQDGQAALMTRGPNWKIDCYPNPGARYGTLQPFTPDAAKWPQKNLLQYPLPEE